MSTAPRISLAHATALVTGASGGLGQAICAGLSHAGAQLIVSGRRETELATVADRHGARAVVADLSVRGDVDHLLSESAEADVAVINAAVPATGEIGDLARGEIDRMLEVNLRVPIIIAKELSQAMVARGGGQLVFITSLASKGTGPSSSMYSATKFGLRGFALALRQDLVRRNVGVSVVSPGFIRDAGMFHDSGARLPAVAGGTRTPADVARAVVRAIEEDRAELEVAPAQLRVGTALASFAPELAARASRRLGSHRVAADLTSGQRDKR